MTRPSSGPAHDRERTRPPQRSTPVDRAVCASLRAHTAMALAVVLAACSADATIPLESARVERQRVERIVVATGTIEPEREVEVRSRIAGIVQRVQVRAGDRVEPGQVLVELDSELTAVEARAARAEVASADVELRLAESELARVAGLTERGAASSRQLEEARARRDIAQAARQRASAAADQLAVQLRYSTLVAPIAGKVLAVLVEQGSAVAGLTAVSGGTIVLKLAEEEQLHLLGLVDENQVGYLRVGQPARITTDAFAGRTIEGHVREIAPLGERRQSVTYFEIQVQLTGDTSGLRPKMSADAEIVADVVDDAVVVPESALRYEGQDVYVERLSSGQSRAAEPARVEIGIMTPGRVQILSGVEPGDLVRVQ